MIEESSVVVDVVVEVVGYRSKVNAPVTGARVHVPTWNFSKTEYAIMCRKMTNVTLKNVSTPYVRLRELEQRVDQAPEPHSMYVGVDVFPPLYTH